MTKPGISRFVLEEPYSVLGIPSSDKPAALATLSACSLLAPPATRRAAHPPTSAASPSRVEASRGRRGDARKGGAG
ncbi:hypothetical protein MTO96_014571 [Rhipicephalus appendiculatus]